MKYPLKLKVNGEDYELYIDPRKTLVEVLRDELELTGTKVGCSEGVCGACTVLIDGKAVKSCLVLALQVEGREVTTIEGLGRDGLHPLQKAFIEHFAVQCGYCTPGMIMSAKALLDEKPDCTEEDIKEALIGNLCRCTGYVKIMEAIQAARDESKSEARNPKY